MENSYTSDKSLSNSMRKSITLPQPPKFASRPKILEKNSKSISLSKNQSSLTSMKKQPLEIQKQQRSLQKQQQQTNISKSNSLSVSSSSVSTDSLSTGDFISPMPREREITLIRKQKYPPGAIPPPVQESKVNLVAPENVEKIRKIIDREGSSSVDGSLTKIQPSSEPLEKVVKIIVNKVQQAKVPQQQQASSEFEKLVASTRAELDPDIGFWDRFKRFFQQHNDKETILFVGINLVAIATIIAIHFYHKNVK